MSRSYGRILASIWSDPDFTGLSRDAQWLYLALLSQPNVSHCGLLALTVRRWQVPAGPDGKVQQWLEELDRAGLVAVDWDTEELLIRSLMRVDGVWRQPNVVKHACGDIRTIMSGRLRAVMASELRRILAEPDLRDSCREPIGAALAGLLGTPPEGHLNPSRNPSSNPSTESQGTLPEPFLEPSTGTPGNPSGNPCSRTHARGGAPSPSPSPKTQLLLPRAVAESDGPTTQEHGGGQAAASQPNGTGRKPKPPDLLWEAVLAACRIDPAEVTPASRGACNAAVAQLRAVGATPEQVPIRAARYRRMFDQAPLTPPALAKHWPALAVDPPPARSRHQRDTDEHFERMAARLEARG